MMRKSNRGNIIVLAIIGGIVLVLFWLWGDVMQWLRVTMHGR
jgi:hypothetical protein